MRLSWTAVQKAALAACIAATALAPLFPLGCKGDPRLETRTAACNADRAELQRLVDQDKQNDKLLHEADREASKGRGAEAAAVIASRAAPATLLLAKRVDGWKPASTWGRNAQGNLSALLQARARGMDAYAEALRSDDLKRVVEQMEAQRKLEQRAVDLDRELGGPLPIQGEGCDPP